MSADQLDEQAAAMPLTPTDCRMCGAVNLLGPHEFSSPCVECGLTMRRPRPTPGKNNPCPKARQ